MVRGTVDIEFARLQLSESELDALISLGWHYTDDRGQPYWQEDYWDDAVELVRLEMGEATGTSPPMAPESR